MVVDQFSKMTHFIPIIKTATTQEADRLFFTHVFKHHGLPKNIVSDRDPKFTRKFWWALWKHMGSKLKMNTSFHPQTDGQIERVNLVIQQFLKNYVVMDQQDWVDHLELAEFCYNNSEHSAIGSTPFQMVTGKSPIVLTTGLHLGNPQVMQVRKCWWSHNLMKRGNAYGRWPRLILKRHINNTRILWTSLDDRWILKKDIKCVWTSKISGCQKVWATSSWAHMRAHSKCWNFFFPTFTN